jgi:serine/threonine protein kinase
VHILLELQSPSLITCPELLSATRSAKIPLWSPGLRYKGLTGWSDGPFFHPSNAVTYGPMNATSSQQEQPLSDSVLARIEEVCERFEAAARDGKRPRVEDYLGDIPEPERTALERELRASEALLRARQGPNLNLDQFITNLADSGLMSVQEIRAFLESQPSAASPPDGNTLAQALIQHGRLTPFQADAVRRGDTKTLILGNYVVLDQLGRGGMGQIFKALHRRMDRMVALKTLPTTLTENQEAVTRFHREVKAAAKLSHPNIVTAHDSDEAKGIHYLVMEYVEGSDLARIVKLGGPLPVAQAVDYILQAARGLQYAHEQGIVHRDIKPSNLLLDKRGTVKILDMGLARVSGLVDEDERDRLTASGQVMGTLDYMAPEQALDTHNADARADIYSLGCTLYRLVTGEAMYESDSLAKILIAHQMSPIPSLCKARGDVSQQLDTVFQKMVAKRADDRQQTMAEVIADLEASVALSSALEDTQAGNTDDSIDVKLLREMGQNAVTEVFDKRADVLNAPTELLELDRRSKSSSRDSSSSSSPHAHVVVSEDGKRWVPASGYTWAGTAEGDFSVKWSPGKKHPTHPHVVASDKEGSWSCAPGYTWAGTAEGDFSVKWCPGKKHPQHSHVVASDEEGSWSCSPGYTWAGTAAGDYTVKWCPGKKHPQHPHVVASRNEGSWNCESGWTWVSTADDDWSVRPRNVIASEDGKRWVPEPGYTWAGTAADDYTVKWCPGKKHPEHPHVVASDEEGSWSCESGWTWVGTADDDWSVKRA